MKARANKPVEPTKSPAHEPKPVQKKKSLKQFDDRRPEASRAVQLQRMADAHREGIVQRQLNMDLKKTPPDDRDVSKLHEAALEYNIKEKHLKPQDRLNALNALNLQVLHWLNDFESPDQNTSKSALWVKDLMNAIQSEHLEVVTQSVMQADEGKETPDPPVAHFDELGEEKETIRAIWNNLLKQSGAIKIESSHTYEHKTEKTSHTEHLPSFRYQVLAQFARLLETKTGRKVVAEVDAGPHEVKIVPTRGYETGSFAGGGEFLAESKGSGVEDGLSPINDINSYCFKHHLELSDFADLNLSSIHDPNARAKAIYKIRKNDPKKAGVCINKRYYAFGKGSETKVNVTHDIPDADTHPTSRFLDKNSHEISSPNFITLGHELGHVSHIQRGSALAEGIASSEIIDQLQPDDPSALGTWSTAEEYANINTVENGIRRDLGLRERFGHGNVYTAQLKLITSINSVLLGFRQREGSKPFSKAVQAYQDIVSGFEIDKTKQGMYDAMEAFEKNPGRITLFAEEERLSILKLMAAAKGHIFSSLEKTDSLLDEAYDQYLKADKKLPKESPKGPVKATGLTSTQKLALGIGFGVVAALGIGAYLKYGGNNTPKQNL